ncbi:hypothetical protein Bealeia1_01577 [Candidatus Bealeia paramacronuclearis]|uniref:Uncharacterized protein n=1 Tax=Candidatus Bealeia paramacronuclearis TaxID=1921001 RepID=A0ABZ2C5I7_9PROT|nr:hypothetical protein [Candidatus Bealeia paramacronuclearis]
MKNFFYLISSVSLFPFYFSPILAGKGGKEEEPLNNPPALLGKRSHEADNREAPAKRPARDPQQPLQAPFLERNAPPPLALRQNNNDQELAFEASKILSDNSYELFFLSTIQSVIQKINVNGEIKSIKYINEIDEIGINQEKFEEIIRKISLNEKMGKNLQDLLKKHAPQLTPLFSNFYDIWITHIDIKCYPGNWFKSLLWSKGSDFRNTLLYLLIFKKYRDEDIPTINQAFEEAFKY